MKRTKLAITAGLVLLLGALMGASCGDKQAQTQDDYGGVGKALDRQEGAPEGVQGAGDESGTAAGASAEVPGVDVSKLSEPEKGRFAGLLDKLPSPCDKPHSLRTSLESDESCKRAPFAGRYVAKLVGEGEQDMLVRQRYEQRYRDKQQHEFSLEGVPHSGPRDAKVTIVEFFDYACPHCAATKPTLDQLVKAFRQDVVLYYKQFPLSSNPTSVPAAMAALEAQRQGKFDAMHEALFAHQRQHDKAALLSYGAEIGLDKAALDKALADQALEQRVLAERQEGTAAGVEGTPTLYINGRQYTDPLDFEALKSWLVEELAVNR